MSKVPFQLLELRLISAQDLAPTPVGPKNLSKNMKTYALIWINPERKLRTEIDKKGTNNPNWNQKFVFRVEDYMMDSASASVMVEIYAAGWLKPTLVGSVSVLIRDLIPPAARQEKRVVALQIRRHSGRPQGILSMGVVLLDNTMKSMPLWTVVAGSTAGIKELDGGKKGSGKNAARLTRSLSDQTNLASRLGDGRKKKNGSICNCPAAASPNRHRLAGGRDGNSQLDGSLNSDIGPSPSVMAIAIAHGLYPLQQRPPPPQPGCSVLEDWTVESAESSVGDQQAKMEQWLVQRHQEYEKNGDCKQEMKKRNSRRSMSVDGGGDGMFSCFGTACGCEFNINFGNGGKKGEKKK